jgi:hypothetical protein
VAAAGVEGSKVIKRSLSICGQVANRVVPRA